MIHKVLEDHLFCVMMGKHSGEVIDFLLKKGINFSILTNVTEVSFDPELPVSVSQNFKPITMFVLAGYTFESAQIFDGKISFEAGFGVSNFGSLVTIPLSSVLQIIVEETPVFINLSMPLPKEKISPKQDGVKRSMDALMSNPHNKKLLK
ncbi:MAG: hypothetical protein PHW07_09075 [Sulfurospirillaceae bacterium]|nr:hypothetical protein [Sulfurospirillaceae bacterium]